MNPLDYVITRKRKKYKFALFHNSSLCYEASEWGGVDFKPDIIEVGAGSAYFLVEYASKHKHLKYVAIDVKGDRLQSGARLAEQLGVDNIKFLRARADQVDSLFKANSLNQIWLTFSDPYPKKRSIGRRLTGIVFLKKYYKILKSNGSLCIKHDNLQFFNWSLEQLVENSWQIKELSYDLHHSILSDDYKILTTYEKRWINDERLINFVRASIT